jgi:KaiC/GvpD/RAD55 family RecA-like ATPase
MKYLIDALNIFPGSWALTPVSNKAPKIKNWQKGVSREIITKEIESGRANGIGLITGELSGFIFAIDCDGPTAHELAERFGGLSKTVSFTSGKKGRAQYLYLVPPEYQEILKDFTRKVLETGTKGEQLELRYNASQSVLPPSKHPETQGYIWTNSIENTPIADLPIWVIEKILDEKPEEPTLDFTQPSKQLKAIPLIKCLSREHRDWVASGTGQGGRNSNGAELARDLIGTELRLQILGISCSDSARDLFDDYCDRCNPSLNGKERETIWNSAIKSNPTPCLSDDKLENCYKAWKRQQQQTPLINTSKSNYQTSGNAALKPEPKHKKSSEGEVREALTKVENILLDFNFDEISQEIKIDQIRQELGIDGKLWDKLRAKVNKKIRGEQLESELRTLLLIDDKIKLTQGLHDLSEKYRIAVNSISNLLKELKLRNTTQQFESMGLDDFFDETSDAVDYLIPGLLPKGESALLVASPKVGKTLLGIDLAFAVATGEDYFLGEKTKTGRVLLVSVDESKQSTKAKLIKRGFRKSDADNIRIITQFEVSQLEKLEAEIEDFHPTLVIIDSLKRITKGSTISENSAEFSDVVYTISELCNRYGASTVLIHHSKKDNETIGVDNVRGSSAIVGALGNVWIMNRVAKEDPNNKKKFIYDPKDTRRQLYCYSRDSEGKAFNLEFNPENNSWEVAGEVGISDAELDERKNNKDRILSVMRANLPHHPEGLKGSFILDCLELEEPGAISKSTMYGELTRLVNAKVIGSKPLENSRGSLYFLFGFGHTTKQTQTDTSVNDESYHKNGNIPSPPPLTHSEFNPNPETTINKEFEVGCKLNNLGCKLVATDFCNQDDATNEKPWYDGVLDIETELVASFGYKGGGGCAPDFVTKTDEPKTYTTTATDVTSYGDRIPDPIENKTTDFDGLDIGGVLITEFKELHLITARSSQQWLTHRGEYVSRAAIQNQDFKVPTIGEMVTAVEKAYVTQDSELAHLLTKTFKNDPFSLFCQAIATDKNLEIIYTL